MDKRKKDFNVFADVCKVLLKASVVMVLLNIGVKAIDKLKYKEDEL